MIRRTARIAPMTYAHAVSTCVNVRLRASHVAHPHVSLRRDSDRTDCLQHIRRLERCVAPPRSPACQRRPPSRQATPIRPKNSCRDVVLQDIEAIQVARYPGGILMATATTSGLPRLAHLFHHPVCQSAHSRVRTRTRNCHAYRQRESGHGRGRQDLPTVVGIRDREESATGRGNFQSGTEYALRGSAPSACSELPKFSSATKTNLGI